MRFSTRARDSTGYFCKPVASASQANRYQPFGPARCTNSFGFAVGRAASVHAMSPLVCRATSVESLMQSSAGIPNSLASRRVARINSSRVSGCGIHTRCALTLLSWHCCLSLPRSLRWCDIPLTPASHPRMRANGQIHARLPLSGTHSGVRHLKRPRQCASLVMTRSVPPARPVAVESRRVRHWSASFLLASTMSVIDGKRYIGHHAFR